MAVTIIMRVKNPPPGTHPSQEWADRQSTPSVAYPGVYEITSGAVSGGTNHRIKAAWWEYTRKINELMGTLEGWHAARRVNAGWINWAANQNWAQGEIIPEDPDPLPIIEGVITIHNYVEVPEKFGQSARIKIFDYLQAPPDVSAVNPLTNPELFDLFRSVNKAGDLGYAPDGKKFYFPRLAKNGIGWLPLDILEPAELPAKSIDSLPSNPLYTALNPTHAIMLDCYQGNGQWIPDSAVYRVDAIIAQSSRGLHVDTEFRRTHDTCQRVGIPFMEYNQYVADFDAIRQADIKLDLIKGLNVCWLWWAYDAAGLNRGKLNAKTAVDSLRAIRYLEQHFGGRVGFYGNRNDISQLYRDAPEARRFKLWLARYPLSQTWWNNAMNARAEQAPYSWKTDIWDYLAWQFGSEVNWLGHDEGHEYGFPNSWSVDVNTWNGTIHEMRRDLNFIPSTPPATPPPTGGDVNIPVKILANPLNIRADHSTSAAKLGTYPLNTIVVVTDIFRSGRDLWGKTDKGWIALRYQGQALTDLCA